MGRRDNRCGNSTTRGQQQSGKSATTKAAEGIGPG
jgi:hypothetical protein